MTAPVESSTTPQAGLDFAVRVVGVSKLYGDFPALQSVALDVSPGEFLALLGRNGAGKTTLLKILALLTRPSSGEVRFGGMEADADPAALRRRMGFLGHNTFLYDDLTAEENLLFYASLYGVEEPRAACGKTLDTVGLSAFARELVRNFSRGMRQRLTIGRMFLHRPDLLLLDEPFNGLDDRAVALLETLLREAHQQGKTIILCTHQLELALRHARRLLILDKGKVAYLGPSEPDRVSQMQELYRRYAG
ncbi:MAG TPA: heme ABC exporter ATP-binding protein CcmA [Terriglobia bacterium]|jgi:heme exporter protein A